MNRKSLTLGFAFAMSFAAGTGTAFAHHSRANFDLEKVVTLNGTVVRLGWTNPHVHIFMESRQPDGTMAKETVEGLSIATLVRQGWGPTSLMPGDHIVVRANPDKNDAKHYYFLNTVTKNGVQVGTGRGQRETTNRTNSSEFAPAPARTESDPFVGVWQPNFSLGGGKKGGKNGGKRGGNRSILTSHPEPSNLPVTAKGAADYAKYKYSDDPRNKCIPESLPHAIGSFPYLFEITRQADGNYLILHENYAAPRVIHMNQKAPPAGTKPDYDGYSVGHMEGNELVVLTTDFSPQPWGNDIGLDSSSEKRIVERYSVTDNGKELQVTYAQTDPVYLTKPVTRTIRWRTTTKQLANVWDGSKCSPTAATLHLTEG